MLPFDCEEGQTAFYSQFEYKQVYLKRQQTTAFSCNVGLYQ